MKKMSRLCGTAFIGFVMLVIAQPAISGPYYSPYNKFAPMAGHSAKMPAVRHMNARAYPRAPVRIPQARYAKQVYAGPRMVRPMPVRIPNMHYRMPPMRTMAPMQRFRSPQSAPVQKRQREILTYRAMPRPRYAFPVSYINRAAPRNRMTFRQARPAFYGMPRYRAMMPAGNLRYGYARSLPQNRNHMMARQHLPYRAIPRS